MRRQKSGCVERTATGKKPAPGAAYEYGAKQDGRRLICVYSGNQKLDEETLRIKRTVVRHVTLSFDSVKPQPGLTTLIGGRVKLRIANAF